MKSFVFALKLMGLGLLFVMTLALGYVIGQYDKTKRIYQGPRIYIRYVDTCASYQPKIQYYETK